MLLSMESVAKHQPSVRCDFVVILAGAGSVDGSTPATATAAAGTSGAAGGSGELAEDMLQMALRMASEMSEEPVMDLEDSVNPAPVRRGLNLMLILIVITILIAIILWPIFQTIEIRLLL